MEWEGSGREKCLGVCHKGKEKQMERREDRGERIEKKAEKG